MPALAVFKVSVFSQSVRFLTPPNTVILGLSLNYRRAFTSRRRHTGTYPGSYNKRTVQKTRNDISVFAMFAQRYNKNNTVEDKEMRIKQVGTSKNCYYYCQNTPSAAGGLSLSWGPRALPVGTHLTPHPSLSPKGRGVS
jgi:hypothetical protein